MNRLRELALRRFGGPLVDSYHTRRVRSSLRHPQIIVILSRGGASRRAGSEGPMHSDHKTYYVYIVTNRSKTLYTGVTNNLERRMWEHKHGTGSEFTSHYKLDRLVY